MRDTRFLRAFYAVCTEGGFGRAAARLHCTQPAVSYQVRVLERDVGAPLFERGGRRAVLTPAGRRLLEFCARYFAEYAQLAADVAGGGPARAEPLRIASVSGFGRYVRFPALARLLDRDAAVRLDLRFRTAAEVLQQVENGDVALGSGASVVPLDAARAAVARRSVRVIRPVTSRRCVNQVFAGTRAGAFLRPEIEAIVAGLGRGRAIPRGGRRV